MTTVLYGIPNCDSVKKARRWLEQNHVAHEFVDLRKTPPSAARLSTWLDSVGDKRLVNRRSTTWKALPDDQRAAIEAGDIVPGLEANVTLIKRPVLEHDNDVAVGFDAADYAQRFTS